MFKYANDSGWIEGNPARGIKLPKVKQKPTLPFASDEMVRIIAACDEYPEAMVRRGVSSRPRLRALVLLMRYSGLRIGDAAACPVERLQANKLLLYTAKTGVPLYVVLPDFVVDALENCPRSNPRFFFWSGAGTVNTNRKHWDKRLRKAFQLAEVDGGHSHRFRDTFAVELLQAGIPLKRVSVLLGHTSIKTTEKHYSPWVQSRQAQLEADLARAWARDEVCQKESLKVGTTQNPHTTRQEIQ